MISMVILRRFRPGKWALTLRFSHYSHTPKKKEANNVGLQSRKSLAEVHGNRTHLPPYSEGTPDLKSGDIDFPRSSSLKIILDNPCKISILFS